MNLHIKTGLGIKNYVWDLNSDVENENFLTDFSWQIWAKNTKIIFSSESVKTKEHKESNSCEKCYFSISAFYKINFWPILKKLSQKIDFLHFPHFEIFAHLLYHCHSGVLRTDKARLSHKVPWEGTWIWERNYAVLRKHVICGKTEDLK